MSTQSGGKVVGSATSSRNPMSTQSGVAADSSATSSRLPMTTPSGLMIAEGCAMSLTSAAPSGSAQESSATSEQTVQSVTVGTHGPTRRRSVNPWNEFQRAHKGMGLSSTQLSKLYKARKP
eukprot:Skav214395  [mRNA]  locus=scaffold2495:27467:27829:+ [translate_table: standard]